MTRLSRHFVSRIHDFQSGFYCFVVLLLLLLLATWCFGHFTWLAAPVEAVPIDAPSVIKYESEFQKAIEAGEEGEINKQWFDLKTTEDLLLTAGAAIGGVPVEVEGEPGSYRQEGGAISILAGLTGTLYSTQPASSVEYLADLGSNLGLVPAAYAQGFGWHAFSPVLALWKTFRNIAYLAFIIIFVVIGFMIMFRKKIDPQTVISVQNALPKIIVTLILITFSYAIAGLIIDLGQLFTRIIANLLAGQDKFIAVKPPNESKRLVNILLQSSTFALVNPLRGTGDLTNALEPILSELGLLQPLAWLTVKFVFITAGFFIMFKIFFALLGPYIGIVLSVIFAPFQLLLDAIPGGGGGLSGWIRNLVANVAVFPVTFAMLAIAAVLRSGPELANKCEVHSPELLGLGNAPWCPSSKSFGGLWAPTMIGNWGEAAAHLAGWGILFTIPKVVQIVQSALQIQPKPWAEAPSVEIKGGLGRIPLIGDFLARQMGS